MTTGHPSVARNVSKRPVARGNAPIAKFHPAFVETNAHPSITRQLRSVQGSTARSAKAVAAAQSAGKRVYACAGAPFVEAVTISAGIEAPTCTCVRFNSRL